MVEVRIKKKPERPRYNPSFGEVAWGVPGAGRGLEEIIQSKPARWLGNVLKNTGRKGADYFDYRPNEGIMSYAKRTFTPSNFFRLPWATDYDVDMNKFAANQAALGTEFTHDLIQLPFEAAGQGLGFDVGSGTGYGDLPAFASTTPSFFGETPSGAENLFRGILGLSYDEAERSALDDIVEDVTMNLVPTWQTDPEGFINHPSFRDYLQNVRGYNIPDDYNTQTFVDKFVVPRIGEMQSYEDFEDVFMPDNEYMIKDEDYWNTLDKAYEQQIELPFQNKIMTEIGNPFYDYQAENLASDLAQRAGISEGFAKQILSGGQEGDLDLGLFNDLLDFYEPFDYKTEEGQEFFNDPLISIAGFGAGTAIPQRLFKKGLQSNKFMKQGIGQLYPSTAGLRFNVYPSIPNLLKRISNKYRGTRYSPTYSKKPYGIPPWLRGATQTALLPALTEDSEDIAVMKRR